MLGALRVALDDREIDLPPRAVGVLVRLAAAGGPLRRDRLLMDLWGDDVAQQRLRSLETTVSRIRRELGSDSIVFGHGSYVLTLSATVDVLDAIAGRPTEPGPIRLDMLGASTWLDQLEQDAHDALDRGSESVPAVRYARDDGRYLAYQHRAGDDPAVVLLGGLTTHCDLIWEAPGFTDWITASIGPHQLINIDKRGTGRSDPITAIPSIEDFTDDILRVLDLTGVEHIVIIAAAEAGLFAARVANRFPGHVAGVVFINAVAKMFQTSDYPHGLPERIATDFAHAITEQWGHAGVATELSAPSREGDDEFATWQHRFQLAAASPGSVLHLAAFTGEVDGRPDIEELARSSVRTIVMASARSRYFRPSAATWLAERLGHHEPIWLDTADHLYWLAAPTQSAALIREFLNQSLRAPNLGH